MKYKDVIYPVVLRLLNSIISSLDAVLAEQEDEGLSNLYLKLDALRDQTKDNYAGILGDPSLGEILRFISEPDIEHQLAPIDVTVFKKLDVLLSMSAMLEGDENLDLDTDIDIPIDNFKIILDTGPALPFNIFGYSNPDNKLDSIGYFHFMENWKGDISNSNFNSALIACAIHTLDGSSDVTYEQKYILVRNDAEDNSSIHAALRLQAVSHGISIHREMESQIKPSLIAALRISAMQPYQQFDESILILSEFNSRSEILNKFLSLYHVLEGFMYKIPIAKLGANNGGKMFSIRDFKRLYSGVERSELKAIKDICKGFWNVRITKQTFGEIVRDKVRNLAKQTGFDKAEFNSLLSSIDVGTGNIYDQLQGKGSAELYAALVYKIRCAVVHNSETEFHISHYNLTQTMGYIFDELLMGPLEVLIFDQIADRSSCIWYKGPALQLYHAQ